MKRCGHCKVEKPFEDFGFNRGSNDGRAYTCKSCLKNMRDTRNLDLSECEKRRRENRLFRDQQRVSNPEARRIEAYKARYGLSIEDYNAMLAAQEGRCAVCRLAGLTEKPDLCAAEGKKGLCVDHDHTTNRVRGLLCWRHNFAIGHCHDSIIELQAVIDYLKNTTRGKPS